MEADSLEYMKTIVLAVGGLIHYMIQLFLCSMHTYGHTMFFVYQHILLGIVYIVPLLCEHIKKKIRVILRQGNNLYTRSIGLCEYVVPFLVANIEQY